MFIFFPRFISLKDAGKFLYELIKYPFYLVAQKDLSQASVIQKRTSVPDWLNKTTDFNFKNDAKGI